MIQIHVSRALAKDLKMHLGPASPVDPAALQWYAHEVILAECKCVIAMELQSRYAMVFCGLTEPDFLNFPDLIQERIWREMCIITQMQEPLEEEDLALLSDLALELSMTQEYQIGSDRSVSSHISQVKDHLEFMLHDGYPLPESDSDCMRFGLMANEMLRRCGGDKDYFVPMEVYRGFWLGLLEQVNGPQDLDDHLARSVRAGGGRDSSNVIKVDFGKRRKG